MFLNLCHLKGVTALVGLGIDGMGWGRDDAKFEKEKGGDDENGCGCCGGGGDDDDDDGCVVAIICFHPGWHWIGWFVKGIVID